jgi:hypothetical protein
MNARGALVGRSMSRGAYPYSFTDAGLAPWLHGLSLVFPGFRSEAQRG